MKKIRVWKVFLLTVVTLGIYELVWLARRRNEMVRAHKLSVPHWLWLIAPILGVVALVLPFALISYGASNSLEGTGTVFLGLILMALLVVAAICLWWGWMFGRAFQTLTQGKVSLPWFFFYFIVLPDFLPTVMQYYVNRSAKSVSASAKKKFKPSGKFIGLTVLLVLLSVPLIWWSTSLSYGDFAAYQEQSAAVDAKYAEVERLEKEHKACIASLEENYPNEDLTDDEFVAYEADYAECEKLMLQYDVAYDVYDAAYDELFEPYEP